MEKFFNSILTFFLAFLIIVTGCTDTFNDEINDPVKDAQISALHQQAKENIADHEKSLRYAQEMLVLAEEVNSSKDIGNAYNIIGAIRRSQNDYVKALQSYIKSSKAFEQAGDTAGMGKVYNNIGNIYRDIQKYDNALLFYQKSLTAKTLLRDKEGMAVTNRNKAFVYQLKQDFEKAKDSYWTSLYLWKTLDNEERMAQLYNDLGIVYDLISDQSTDTSNAIEKNIVYNLHLNSLELHEKVNNIKGKGWAFNNIAISLIEQNQYQEALDYLEKSINLKKSGNDQENLATTYNNIGHIYLHHIEKPDIAIDYFKLAEKYANEEELENTYEYLSSTLEQEGNYPQAIDYFRKLDLLKEELRKNEYQEELAKIEARYSIEYAGL